MEAKNSKQKLDGFSAGDNRSLEYSPCFYVQKGTGKQNHITSCGTSGLLPWVIQKDVDKTSFLSCHLTYLKT